MIVVLMRELLHFHLSSEDVEDCLPPIPRENKHFEHKAWNSGYTPGIYIKISRYSCFENKLPLIGPYLIEPFFLPGETYP